MKYPLPRWFAVALLVFASLGAQDQPARPAIAPPDLVLAAAGGDDVPIAAYGLGDGGVQRPFGRLRFEALESASAGDAIDCVTPGGVRVRCRSVGVMLKFPSGCAVLLGPDGTLHLRSGERAGPFAWGVELRLADGSAVRVSLAPSRRDRVREVVVVAGDRQLQPWHRGKPAERAARAAGWAGVRLVCCGDGGDLYRPYALGPLLVLDRQLVAEARAEQAPAERLVLLTDPIRTSLQTMQRGHREANTEVRRAISAVAAVADRASAIFPAGAGLMRAEQDRARWTLRGGFELEIDFGGPLAPRLQLFAGRQPVPMVEWTLGPASAAYLSNPRDDQPGKRWHGNGTRLPRAVPELQVREHLDERPRALQILRRFERRRPTIATPPPAGSVR